MQKQVQRGRIFVLVAIVKDSYLFGYESYHFQLCPQSQMKDEALIYIQTDNLRSQTFIDLRYFID